MAKFYLKDWHGKEQEFTDDKIFARGENGELIQFTQGEGESTLEPLEVTENGNYTPGEGVDGFNSVSVNVPDIPAVVQPLEVTENGTYTAPDGVDGYSPISVNVSAPEIKLQEKTITENGEYTADAGFDGLAKVLVEVAGGAPNLKIKKSSWTSDGAKKTITHNFGVIPDLVILTPDAGNSSTGAIGTSDGVLMLVQGKDQSLLSYRYGFSLRKEGSNYYADSDTSGYLTSGRNTQYAYATETTVEFPATQNGTRFYYTIIAGLS